MSNPASRAVLPAADGQPAKVTSYPALLQDALLDGKAAAEDWLESPVGDSLRRAYSTRRARLPGRLGEMFEAGFMLRLEQRFAALQEVGGPFGPPAPDGARGKPPRRVLREHLEWRMKKVRQGGDGMRQENCWMVFGQIELAVMAGWFTATEAVELEDRLHEADAEGRDSAARRAGHD